MHGEFKKYKLITKRTYDITSHYFAERDRLDNISEKKEVVAALNRFSKLLPKGAMVLDVGCGAGRDSRFLFKKRLKVIGVDFSHKMIEASQKINPKIKYKVMDLEKLKFKKGTFNGVWANASLHHIPKPHLKKVFRNVYRMLKRGGILFVKVKYGKKEGVRENVKFGKLLKRYFAFYKPKELAVIIRAAKFKILDIHTTTHREWVDVFAKK